MTAVVALCKFPLYCNIGSQSLGASVLVGWWSVLLNALCQFPSDCVFFLVTDFSFNPLCSAVLRGEGEIIHKEENTITRKLTECIQENRSSGVTALRQQQLNTKSSGSHT